ncbi:MAG: hypothetical protein HZB56_16725 [Deltaproteobacteria bacterium]|nr:hypothetical protein [Deltaproteobacteria bacterium]
MTAALALLCASLAAAPQLPGGWLGLQVLGWTADGSALAWKGADSEPRSEAGDELWYLVVTDARARPRRVFKLGEDAGPLSPCAPAACAGKAWRAAEPEAAAEAWQAQNPVSASRKAKPALAIGEGKPAGELEGVALSLALVRSGKGCPVIALRGQLGEASATLAEDRCGPGEEEERQLLSAAELAWSPDGSRVAVAWTVRRFTVSGGGAPGAVRAHMAVVSRRSFATVDLLDAGAGKALGAIAEKLDGAGFPIAHRGKAGKRRAATEVYFAPGFEKEAREAAALAGAAPEAVKPLDWKSPHAITVAAGGR